MKPLLSYRKIVSNSLCLVFSVMLLAAACQPLQLPRPDQSGVKETPTSKQTAPDGLPVEDKGAPLAPQVVKIIPSGGQELALSGEITLGFDQDMDTQTTRDAWELHDPDKKKVGGEVSWQDARTMRFIADSPLSADTLYSGVLGTSAASSEGVQLAEPLQVTFNSQRSLEVSQVFPQDGGKDIPNSAVITAIFNRPVVPLVSAGERQQLPDPLVFDPPVSGRGEWVSTSVYAFQPGRPLKSGRKYSVTIKAGTQDAAMES